MARPDLSMLCASMRQAPKFANSSSSQGDCAGLSLIAGISAQRSMLDEFTDPELTSLVLKRVPPRCTSTVLLDMLDACGGLYDFVHLPYDIRHHKNLSLAFINFLDHETARAAFAWLSEHSNFPQGLAPSTQVHWGHVHGLGPNLSHFVARFGMNALDPPYAPYVFIDGRSVPRSRDVVTNLGPETSMGYMVLCSFPGRWLSEFV